MVERRLELIRTLDSVAFRLPGDGWIAGQRVRYKVEAGDLEGAAAAAAACRSPERWWCHALEGYAFHSAGDFVRADSAFRLALAAMPEEERCEWTDLSLLLERDGRRSYGELECGEREAFEQAFWWLADPLWLLPGNDRRTEHFSRHVLHRLQRGADSGYGLRWSGDLRELLLRYGWAAGFKEVRRVGAPPATRPTIMAYDPPGTRRFAPPDGWPGDPAALDRDRWELDPSRPRSHYAPDYARHFQPLVHQLAIFRRGDSAVVVAGYDLDASRDTLPPCDSLVVGLGAARAEPRGPPGLVVTAHAGERASLMTTTLSGSADDAGGRSSATRVVVSLEAFCPGRKYAARERYVARVPEVPLSGIGLSDILLLEEERTRVAGARPLAARLEEAVPRARPSASVREGEGLALYWEVYRGPAAPDAGSLKVSVRLARESGGFFRRAMEWVGLAGEGELATGLEWSEAFPREVSTGRAIAVGLPELPEGEYRLELEVRAPGQDPLVRSRRIEVER